MAEVLQANIFFFITSVAVVIFTLLLCVALFYVIKILRKVKIIVDRVEAGSEAVAEDISQLRTYIAEGSLISQIVGMFFRSKKSRSKKK